MLYYAYCIVQMFFSGPKLEILYANVNAPGRWHDSYVLQRSSLYREWEHPEPAARQRPFPGAVILGTYFLLLTIVYK